MSNLFQIDDNVFDRGVAEAVCKADELMKIRPKMQTMTVEENAKYADLVCRTYGTNEAFVDSMMYSPPPGEQLELKLTEINTTGVGGVAFLSLYAPRKDQRAYYSFMYDELKKKGIL